MKTHQEELARTVYLDEIDYAPGHPDESSRLTTALLPLEARQDDPSLGDHLVSCVQQWTGFRCVGLRLLLEDGSLIYSSYVGYSRNFWLDENLLSTKYDHCACTRVAVGKPEPQDLAAMTPNGSFCTPHLAKFVETLNPEEQARFRCTCLRAGFQSLAVIPITYNGSIIGALHLADERPNCTSAAMIAELERSTPLLGQLLSHHAAFSSKPSGFSSPSSLDSLLGGIEVIAYVADPETHKILYANRVLRELLPNDPVGGICYSQLHGHNRPCNDCGSTSSRRGSPQLRERACLSAQGKRDYLMSDRTIGWSDGRPAWLCFGVPTSTES